MPQEKWTETESRGSSMRMRFSSFDDAIMMMPAIAPMMTAP